MERSSQALAELQRLPCLAEIPEAEIAPLVPLLTFRTFFPQQRIIVEGEEGGHFFFILEGQIRVSTTDQAGRQVFLATLERGDFFGEGSLFTGRPRSATVEAVTTCWTLQTPRDALRQYLEGAPALRAALYEAHRQRQIVTALSRVPIFSALPRAQRLELATYLTPRSYPRQSVIIREGDLDRSLFLIAWGQAAVVQGDRTDEEQALTLLEPGDFFGEMALLLQRPRTATVRSLTHLEVLELPATSFQTLLDQWPLLRRSVEQVVSDRLRRTLEVQVDPQMAQVLNQFVLGEAAVSNRLLIRERMRCPRGCRRCEEACRQRFGHSRIHLDGVVLGYLAIPVACRHCLYPACVEVCPFDALEWDKDGRLFINERCQGCGQCARACPYGAIEMAQITPEPAQGLLGRLLAGILGQDGGESPDSPRPLHPEKCDLCRGYPEQACLAACPTGALKLVNAEEYFAVPSPREGDDMTS